MKSMVAKLKKVWKFVCFFFRVLRDVAAADDGRTPIERRIDAIERNLYGR